MLVTSQCITHGWLVLSPQLKKLVDQIQHEVQRLEVLPPPQDSFHPMKKAEEMKLQILDEGLDSNREGENYFIF